MKRIRFKNTALERTGPLIKIPLINRLWPFYVFGDSLLKGKRFDFLQSFNTDLNLISDKFEKL